MNDNKRTSAFKEKRDYDILNMLNSISNFEIFTPFEITKSMIELLPEEVFKHPEYKFLDPCVKSGIFLREIIYKLDENLPRIKYKDKESNIEYDLSNKKERTTHILKNMIYGIAISELTSYVSRRTIYGVMEANKDKIEEYLQSKILANRDEELLEMNEYYNHNIFNDREEYIEEGNIFYPANETTIETEDTHYPFIVKTNHKIINRIKERKMKFDVIIGNPPYQQNVGNIAGNKSKSKAIYHHFISNAIDLKPKYISMIVPSRWMTKSAEGISDKWVDSFIKDKRIQIIHDYLNSEDCFKNVDIKGGVNYFLWNSQHQGNCQYNLHTHSGIKKIEAPLDEFNLNFVLRNIESRTIINKIKKVENNYLNDNSKNFYSMVSPKDFFTNKKVLTSSWDQFHSKSTIKNNIKCYVNKKICKEGFGFTNEEIIPKNKNSININKVLIPSAAGSGNSNDKVILGQPILALKGSVCSQTYLVIGYDEKNHNFTENECKNIISYIKTKFFRYLVSLKKKTQNGARGVYQLVPIQDFNKSWTDEELYKKYNLSDDEINYIENKISKMD